VPRNTRSNPLALAVLACLYERPMHPYEVAQTLRSRAKHESIRLNYGSLYGVVELLEKRGFIRARETVREGRRPERTIYEITDDGAREQRAERDIGLPRLFAIENEYVEALVRAELEFVSRLVKDIESGELDGIDLWRSFAVDGDVAWHPPERPET